jgi:SagB-type dehydrogenase family enzyme
LSSLSFDLSVYDVFGTLGAGATLVLPEAGAERDAGAWAELVQREGVTVWNSVPALLEMLLEYAAGGSGVGAGLQSLRLVLLSGDWIGVGLPARLRSWVPGVEVVSLGGATEASIWSIAYRIGEVAAEWASIPYGRPLANQQFAVLNRWLEPCPVWVAGELYIGGAGLARGYWRDAEKTAGSFVRHPESGERLYRTGDLGRYLPGGVIEFMGREDTQVKVQGHRIELGEIESALLRCPGVRQAVVTAAGEAGGPRRLVAYVVAAAAPEPAAGGGGGLVLRPAPLGEPAAAAARPLPSQVSDKLALLEFKLSEPGLRRGDEGRAYVELSESGGARPAAAAYLWRRSHRRFASAAVEAQALGRLLGALRSLALPQDGLEKYRYASAGHLYPVQTYVYVKPGRVAGVAGGMYYHHPHDHRLVSLAAGAGATLDRTAYAEVNRGIFDEAAFALFLVGKPDPGLALDGGGDGDGSALGLIAAGAMGQLLMEAAPAEELGLCPIGSVDLAALAPLLAPGGELLLHSLLGGVAAAATAAAAPDPEVDALEWDVAAVDPGGPVAAVAAGLRGERLRAAPAVDGGNGPGDNGDGRSFLDEAVPGEQLAGFLGALRQVALPGWTLPKYRYPSAGNLYPVQVYLEVRPGRVAGLPGGAYYYHPKRHRLVQLAAADSRGAAGAAGGQDTAFTLFLVGELQAIAPVYGARARDFCLLEAGYMAQLLLAAGPPSGVGLEATADLDAERTARRFGWSSSQLPLYSLEAGRVPASAASGLPDSHPLRTTDVAGTSTVPPDTGDAEPHGPAPSPCRLLDSQLEPQRSLARALPPQLAAMLPSHMVPASFLFLDRLPLSGNGKVDRAALPASGQAATPPESFAPPQGQVEEILAQVWSQVLRVERVGRHDNFIALGGDSILLIQAVTLMRAQGLAVTVRQVFENQTIAELAAAIAAGAAVERQEEAAAAAAPATLQGIDPRKLARIRAKYAAKAGSS